MISGDITKQSEVAWKTKRPLAKIQSFSILNVVMHIATTGMLSYRLDGTGTESQLGARFSAPVQTGHMIQLGGSSCIIFLLSLAFP
jgi:hypothetical protein